MNPNEAFKQKNNRLSSKRVPYGNKLVIRCGGCGWTITVYRKVWLSDQDIVCHQCGRTSQWDIA